MLINSQSVMNPHATHTNVLLLLVDILLNLTKIFLISKNINQAYSEDPFFSTLHMNTPELIWIDILINSLHLFILYKYGRPTAEEERQKTKKE